MPISPKKLIASRESVVHLVGEYIDEMIQKSDPECSVLEVTISSEFYEGTQWEHHEKSLMNTMAQAYRDVCWKVKVKKKSSQYILVFSMHD